MWLITMALAGWTVMTPQLEAVVPLELVSAQTLLTTDATYSGTVSVTNGGGCSRGSYRHTTDDTIALDVEAGGAATLTLKSTMSTRSYSRVRRGSAGRSRSATRAQSQESVRTWTGRIDPVASRAGSLVIKLGSKSERAGQLTNGPRPNVGETVDVSDVDITLRCGLDAVALAPAPTEGPKLAQVLRCTTGDTDRQVFGLAADGPILLRTGAPLVRETRSGRMIAGRGSVTRIGGLK